MERDPTLVVFAVSAWAENRNDAAAFWLKSCLEQLALLLLKKKILSSPHSSPSWQPQVHRYKNKIKSREKEKYKSYGEGHGDSPVSPVGMIFIVIYVS